MSVMESVWRKLFTLFNESEFWMDIVGSNVLSLTVFWSFAGLLAVTDLTGRPTWMTRYKTQTGKNQPVDRTKVMNAVKVVLFNQIFISIPVSVVVFYFKTKLGASARPELLPRPLTVVRDLMAFVAFEEIGFYYTHRFVHWGPMYKTVHKQHHEWIAPIGIVALYAHPVEYLLSNLFPLVLGPMVMTSHLATTWLWYTVGLMTTIIHHSGYHLPFAPSNEFHDFHHLKFTCNYGLTGWLDWLHGTDKQFRDTPQQRRDHIVLGLKPAM